MRRTSAKTDQSSTHFCRDPFEVAAELSQKLGRPVVTGFWWELPNDGEEEVARVRVHAGDPVIPLFSPTVEPAPA